MSPWPWVDPLPHALALLIALAWDRWAGEPPSRLHPVVWMGRAIGWLRDRAPSGPGPAFSWGLLMAVLLPAAFALLALLSWVPGAGLVFATWLLTSCFAVQGLTSAGLRVAEALERGDLAAGRAGLGWLCSRDPADLDATALSAAATESVVENASDSLVAPLFWYAVAGLPGILAYRCVNTLDAMIGYRDRFEWLGKAAARLDDLLNLVPARLTALALLLLAPTLPRTSARRGLAVLRADAGKTASPNAGWPMAATAGILGVRLEKADHYVLGGAFPPPGPADLRRACTLSGRVMWGVGVGVVVGLVVFGLG